MLRLVVRVPESRHCPLLLIASAGSLWCLKLGLLAFYSRFIYVFHWGKAVVNALWAFIALSFVAVLITTLVECRPLSL